MRLGDVEAESSDARDTGGDIASSIGKAMDTPDARRNVRRESRCRGMAVIFVGLCRLLVEKQSALSDRMNQRPESVVTGS